jgi:hypothetical protein
MKPALIQPRSSALVQADLEAFDEIIRDAAAPRPGDVAAEAQWRAWRNHRAELEEELAQARLVEQAVMHREGPLRVEDHGSEENPFRVALVQLIEKIRHLLQPTRAREARSGREAALLGGAKDQRSGRQDRG